MRVVVCDDDPLVRSVVGAVVLQLDGEVVAEADGSADALTMIEQLSPDVVVLDLALKHGTGVEVLDRLQQISPDTQAVVFTAFDDVASIERRCVVVRKPDFTALERELTRVGRIDPTVDRRRATRPVRSPESATVDDVHDFYRMLAEAVPGDALVAVTTSASDTRAVAAAVRRSVRAEDRVLVRNDLVLALLIGGGASAEHALHARLRTEEDVDPDEVRSVVIGEDPVEAFTSLTAT